MRKNFGPKPVCYAMPVFIIATYNEDGTPNAMTASWGGISEVDQFTIRIEKGHKTAANAAAQGAFTVSMATLEQMTACDYVGIVSGNKVPDKFEKAGFHATASEFVNAPLIDELPLALECETISYNPETQQLVGKIRNMSADESILGEKGKVDASKMQLITYDPVSHDYLILGGKVGLAYREGLALK